MRSKALLLAPAILLGALALSPAFALAAEPYARPSPAVSGDAYAYQRSSSAGGEAYSYRRETSESGAALGAPVGGQVNCEGYCLPPGYVIEDPYQDERIRTGETPLEEDRYSERRTIYEERGGYSWGYGTRGDGDRRAEGWDHRDREDEGRDRCRQRFDAQGRMIESCGEIRLSDSFFWGGGGVGPEYIDAGGGGGGGGYVEAGAGASAYASARASVGVSIRIGGRGGHKGGSRGGHGGKGGCGCGH